MKHREEEQNNEAPPEERQPLPLGQSLSCGVGTFLAAGLVDAFAHLGPTGLVVGGIAAYVATQHGPELIEQVKGALWQRPSSDAQVDAPRILASDGSRGGKRSILDRALGRFPTEEETSLEDADTLIVDEPEETPRASSQSFRPSVLAQVVRHPICLAPDLVLEGNDIVGQVSISSASREVAKRARWRGWPNNSPATVSHRPTLTLKVI